MTIEQFKYVLETARTGSMNQAAANLFLSQSTLSLSIKALEGEIGRRIFIRGNKGIKLTPFGQTFISYITPMILQMDGLERLCDQYRFSQVISLSICDQGFPFVANVCSEMYRNHKNDNIHIELYDAPGDEAVSMVADRQIEIGVIRIWNYYKNLFERQFAAKNIIFNQLYSAPIAIMIGPGNPLFKENIQSIRAEQLKYFPIIVDSYVNSTPYADLLKKLNLSDTAGHFLTNSRAVIYEMLEQTPAFYLSSNINLKENYFHKNTKSILLENCDVRTEVGWIRNQSYVMTPAAGECISLLEQYFSDFPKQG